MPDRADLVVIGAGLAGLVAAAELADAGRRVLVLEQEPGASLGGQAHWSFGGLFLVDTPEQRRLRIRDSRELAWQDWLGAAAFDGPEDEWGRRWAEAYVDFASGEKRAWLHDQGVRWFPIVQWAERGGYLATGHGNSVPRFHVTWGTGPGVVEPFVRRVRADAEAGAVELRFRHRVTQLVAGSGAVRIRGEILADSEARRGHPSSREVTGEFEVEAGTAIVASGGIGGNHELLRAGWPERLGRPPAEMLSGVPDHVDGAMLSVVAAAGGRIVHPDRMWSYPDGVRNFAPIWTRHGIRILSGPSPLWLDAWGRRLPAPLFPGFDALGALAEIARSGVPHSWLLLNRRILRREIALSGSEQNPDLTLRRPRMVLRRAMPGTTAPIERFAERCPDFLFADTLEGLVDGMNSLAAEQTSDSPVIDPAALRREVEDRDRQVTSGLGKDAQLAAIRSARRYLGDRLMRVAPPHPLLDQAAGPLVAIRLSILSRKTLGGIQTDLDARVLDASGAPIPGLFAAGEAAGFGGGGMHGNRSLEGTFLGGCLFSGRVAGRSAARA